MAAALPLLTIGAVEVLMNRAGVIFLGWIGETKNAGIFSLAFNIAFLVAIPKTAVNTLFTPAISRLFDRKDHVKLQELFTKSTIWWLCASIVIAVGLLVIVEFRFDWFGNNFSAGVLPLRVLLIGQVSCRRRIAGTDHDHDGERKRGFAAHAHRRGCQVIATVILTLWFGMIGAAFAAIGSMIIWNILSGSFYLAPAAVFGFLAIFVQPNLIKSFARLS